MEKMVEAKEYDYIMRQNIINNICSRYEFLRKSVIGKSCGGRDITALRLGSTDSYCLMTAAFHGSERITSTVLLMFIEELCDAISKQGTIAELRMPRALRGRGIIFVPCVNPDGCEISLYGKSACGVDGERIERICRGDFSHWNANLCGVDINHNFDAGWQELRQKEKEMGINGPSMTRYGGPKPESEPETLALTELCRKIPIRHALALHSQGEVIYWSYGPKQPPRSRKMAEIMATSSGYALDIPIGIATGGGFKDWFISAFNRPGFTVELGFGKNPLPADSAEEIYLKVREMLTLYAIM